MDVQQIITLLIVAVAAGWLLRNVACAVRDFRRGKGGCASGCGKCAFAVKEGRKEPKPRKPESLISLSEIQTLPRKK